MELSVTIWKRRVGRQPAPALALGKIPSRPELQRSLTQPGAETSWISWGFFALPPTIWSLESLDSRYLVFFPKVLALGKIVVLEHTIGRKPVAPPGDSGFLGILGVADSSLLDTGLSNHIYQTLNISKMYGLH